MSALGQKQTLRHLQPMSALPPQKRTLVEHVVMSALCQKRHMQRTRSCPLWVTADIAASATHRKAKLILPIIQIATAATRPALTNTPDTTAALNRITPNAYVILSSRITLMKRPNTQ